MHQFSFRTAFVAVIGRAVSARPAGPEGGPSADQNAERMRCFGKLWRKGASAATVCCTALLLTMVPPPAAAQLEFRLSRIASYIPDLPQKKEMNRTYRREVETMRNELHRRQSAGENQACSAQILQEVHWLVNYTVRRDAVESRLADLRRSLHLREQSFVGRQDPRDGTFGACFDAWIWRFFASVDPLKEMALRGERPEIPLSIWEPIDTPDELTAFMESLLISDVADGHNKRKELNMAVTALGQLLWLDSTASVFPDHLDRKPLAKALTAFVDKRWQDPETGYWGAWYLDEGEIRKTNDLSNTFHIVSYRGGNVPFPRRIAQTTFAIRNLPYPFGWEGNGQQNNHHAYDVARIINLIWDDLDMTQRANARALVLLQLYRSIGLSINDDGSFDTTPYSTVGEAYYFGLSFIEEANIFVEMLSHRQQLRITNADGLLDRIERHLQALEPSDPMIAAAKRKLERIRQYD